MRTLKTYVISLPEAKERRAQIKEQLGRFSIEFAFFDAVDGRQYDVNAHTAYNGKKRRKFFGRDMTGGELGCLLSHRAIYQNMIAQNTEIALILEDDAVLDERFPQAIDLLKKTDTPFELVRFLGSAKVANLEKRLVTKLDDTFSLHRLRTTPGGAHAYVLTYEAAKKLYEHTGFNYLPIDTLIGHVWQTGINALVLQPGLATQDLKTSYIGDARFDKKVAGSFWQKILFPMYRAWFKAWEGIMKTWQYWRTKKQDLQISKNSRNNS